MRSVHLLDLLEQSSEAGSGAAELQHWVGCGRVGGGGGLVGEISEAAIAASGGSGGVF